MMKKYVNMSIVYAIVAMVFGVFYREFTKFMNFTGETNLSVMHTHYFMLGMFFFLVLVLLENSFSFSKEKGVNTAIVFYNIGLNITGIAFLIRGLTQVYSTELSTGADAAISGLAGLGHIILGVCILVLLFAIKKSVKNKAEN